MKKLFFFAILMATALTTTDAEAQKFPGLDKSPHDVASFPRQSPVVKVVYGRPQLKGRDLETLAPSGKVWRTGANEATEITFKRDVNFGGKMVKAGTYSLFTIPANGASDWTIILNTDTDVWGAYSYDESKDVARVNGKQTVSTEPIEAFSVAFTGDATNMTLHLGWGNKVVSVDIQ